MIQRIVALKCMLLLAFGVATPTWANPGANGVNGMCPVRGGTLVVAHASDAVGLDPHIATPMTSTQIYEQAYETLIQFDADLTVQPVLAEQWDISPDGKTYTFHLREGVKFTNGRELTARDVKYSVERLISLGGAFSARFGLLESIETPDAYTVRFQLSQSFAPFLSTLADPKVAIVAEEVVAEHGNLQQVVIGTGPFVLDGYNPGSEYRFVRNVDYWNEGFPCVDQLVVKIVPEEATRVAMLRNGDVDLAPLLEPLSVQILNRAPNVDIAFVPMLQRNLLVIQTQRPPLDDVRVRQALMLATDREAIVRTVQHGQGEVSGVYPTGLGPWATPVEQLPFYASDINEAQKLLAEAGHPDGFQVTMMASPAYGLHIPIAQVLQQQWKRINVDVQIQSVEWGVLLDHWGKGSFDILSMPYDGRTDPYFYTYERFHSDSPGNASRLSDAELDDLMVQAMVEVDPERSMELYTELERKIIERAPIIYLSSNAERFGVRRHVHNFIGVPMGNRPNYAFVWLGDN